MHLSHCPKRKGPGVACTVCGNAHFTEYKIAKALTNGQRVLLSSADKVDLDRINSLTGKNLKRNSFGDTIFYLDCRYFKVLEGKCPLANFKMGTAATELIVGRVDRDKGSKQFYKCASDLSPVSQFGGSEQWMNSLPHMVDLFEFLDTYEQLTGPEEFSRDCIREAKALWNPE
jgi:hypothetical protein